MHNHKINEFCQRLGITPAQFSGTEIINGHLYLSSLTAIPDGFNPTVGGDLDLNGLWVESKNKPTKKIITSKNKLLFWQDGKYVSADLMFTEVLSKKGNVYRVRKVHSQKEFYLVTNGEFHAHGETAEKAKEDFRFKLMADKLKNEPINADTIVSIKHFRLVTGACEFGTKSWLDQNNIKVDAMKASDLLPLLEKTNAFGLEKFKKHITFS